jgi:hypothetical protein
MTQNRNLKQNRLGHLILEFGVYLACVREVQPCGTKAGIWNFGFKVSLPPDLL